MTDEEFSAFYAATYQRLLGQLVLLCGDRAEAEDALQEAFARAAVRWPRLRSYQAPEAWVRRVALNLTRMAARRQPSCRPRPSTCWLPCAGCRSPSGRCWSCTTLSGCRWPRSPASWACRW